MASSNDEECEVTLRDQRYFGAGLKRKRIQFVPSTSASHEAHSSPNHPSASAADRYLSIVFGAKSIGEVSDRPPLSSTSDIEASWKPDCESTARAALDTSTEGSVCHICHKPVAVAQENHHDRSIAHQVCLQHSHPPSHVDRTRKGLAVLEGHGWDPDSRLGLGATGEGILHPVKAVENPGRAGLGARPLEASKVSKKTTLDAGKVKQLDKEQKRRAEKLRDAFYRNDDVEKYLRG